MPGQLPPHPILDDADFRAGLWSARSFRAECNPSGDRLSFFGTALPGRLLILANPPIAKGKQREGDR